MDFSLATQFIIPILIFFVALIILKSSVKAVPQNQAYIVERFGKYNRTLEAGLNFIIPFMDNISAKQTLKEQAVDTPSQGAITKDNITLTVDGILYLRVLDPYKATYGVDDYMFAVSKLAQTTMRSEIGKMDLDKTFEERENLNASIVNAINEAASIWGIQVLRYEVKDLNPPQSVMEAMEQQMKAEREKRAQILESEGVRQAKINHAEGEKQARVLAAEAEKEEQILIATGQAESLRIVGEQIDSEQGKLAMQYDLAMSAIKAKEAIAKESTIMVVPDGQMDVNSTVAQAMAISTGISNAKA